MPAATLPEDHARLLSRMRAQALFLRMLEAQGITPDGRWWHGFEALIDASLARCGACPHTAACLIWLERFQSPHQAPTFCPNGTAIEACRIAASDPASGNCSAEPPLYELLDDPTIQQLMAADRVSRDMLWEIAAGLNRARSLKDR